MIYDIILMGASLPFIIKSLNYDENINILIIEKSNYLGGSWRINCNNIKNIDLGCHLIVPPTDIDSENIIKYFKKYLIDLQYTTNKTLYSDNLNYKSYNKEGKPLICINNWIDMMNKLIKIIKKEKYKNYKIQIY